MYNDETVQNFKLIGANASKRAMTLKTLEGHILATELNAIAMIPHRLFHMERSNSEAAQVPDFVGIGIHSIKALSARYGVGSPQVLDALRLLDFELQDVSGEVFARLAISDFILGFCSFGSIVR